MTQEATTISLSEWKRNYATLLRYCSKITNYKSSRDLLHEVYLYWLIHKEEDIFEKETKQAIRVIKNVYGNQIRSRKYMWRGKLYHRKFTNDSVHGDYENENSALESINFNLGGPYAEQRFENEDLVSKFLERLTEFDRKVLDLKVKGYKAYEIEKAMDRTNPIISASIKNIKQKMKTILLNPFNCSKVKVIKRVTRKTFDAHPENYADYEKGEYYEYNEYYTLLTSKSNPNEGLLIKEEAKDWYIS